MLLTGWREVWVVVYGTREIEANSNTLWIIISWNKLIIFAESQPPAKPSVFIMKNGTNVACLVKDFYPRNVTINLLSSKKIVEFDPAIVVSPSGKYSAVKLGQYEDSNSVTCSVQHNHETWYSTEFEKMVNSSGMSYLALGSGIVEKKSWGKGSWKCKFLTDGSQHGVTLETRHRPNYTLSWLGNWTFSISELESKIKFICFIPISLLHQQLSPLY